MRACAYFYRKGGGALWKKTAQKTRRPKDSTHRQRRIRLSLIHIYLKRGDTGVEHRVKLRLDALVPVIDGHVEAIVAVALAVRLFMPEIKPVGKGFSFIGAGEVDDRRRAAANGAFAAAFKIIGRCGVAHVKVKVRVRVDKAGKERAARHIDDLALRGEIGRDMACLLYTSWGAGRRGRPHRRAPA